MISDMNQCMGLMECFRSVNLLAGNVKISNLRLHSQPYCQHSTALGIKLNTDICSFLFVYFLIVPYSVHCTHATYSCNVECMNVSVYLSKQNRAISKRKEGKEQFA